MGVMLQEFADALQQIADRTGWVTWPLLAISVIAVTMMVERALFWYRTNRAGARRRLARMSDGLAAGDRAGLMRLLRRDNGVYATVLRDMLESPGSAAVATEAVERQRPRLERFMPALSTIITVCPMLGILGTVTGIIASFEAFARQQATADLGEVSRGIAEALWSTAGGLTVTMVVLFPYNIFRAQLDRTLGRIEVLAAQVSDVHSRLGGRTGSVTPSTAGVSGVPGQEQSSAVDDGAAKPSPQAPKGPEDRI